MKKRDKTSISSDLKKDLYLTIFSYVENNQRLPQHLLPKTNLQFYVSRLKKEGFIQRKGYGVWEVLKPYNKYKLTPKVANNIRGHGFVYKVKLPTIKNWGNRITYLQQKKLKFTPLNGFQRISYKGYKIWLCNHSIIIYVPKNKDYFSNSASNSQKYAINDLNQLLESLEGYFGFSLKINGQYHFKVSRQHYGKIKDALAIQCNRNNEKIYCYYNGEGWLVIDNSKGLNETETLHPVTATKDMDKIIIPFMNDLKESYEKTNELIKPSELLKMVNGVVSVQTMFAENLQSHVKAIKELTDGVAEFRKEIKNIKRKV